MTLMHHIDKLHLAVGGGGCQVFHCAFSELGISSSHG